MMYVLMMCLYNLFIIYVVIQHLVKLEDLLPILHQDQKFIMNDLLNS